MSVREILERALDTLDVDDVVDDWDARKMLETAVREALATLYAETVREILSGGERTISPGGGMEQRPDWRPYLQESSAEESGSVTYRIEQLTPGPIGLWVEGEMLLRITSDLRIELGEFAEDEATQRAAKMFAEYVERHLAPAPSAGLRERVKALRDELAANTHNAGNGALVEYLDAALRAEEQSHE